MINYLSHIDKPADGVDELTDGADEDLAYSDEPADGWVGGRGDCHHPPRGTETMINIDGIVAVPQQHVL